MPDEAQPSIWAGGEQLPPRGARVSPGGAPVRLDDRYSARTGSVLLSGIQALVRLILEVRRADDAHGHDTGAYVSGYEGSPLGGLDLELARARPFLEQAGVVFQPGLNEELAATAVGGTQLLGELDTRLKQGVTGFWYGKSPGFDRAADALRHANFSGTAPLGGAVALIGDDPTAKSSTVPSACEAGCRSLLMPLLAPGSVEEIVRLGLHAVALSRHCGLWIALKLVTELADSTGQARIGVGHEILGAPAGRAGHRPPLLLPPDNLRAERELLGDRLERVAEYERRAQLNAIVHEPPLPRMAIVASGFGHQAVLRALERLELDRDGLDRLGLRLVRIAMPWPLATDELQRLVGGVESVLVIEDKLPFVEAQIKEALYRDPQAPRVLGKYDRDGLPLLPLGGAIGADEVIDALGRLLGAQASGDGRPPGAQESGTGRAPGAQESGNGPRARPGAPDAATVVPVAKRSPYFCSGCPHNTSTRADADDLVGVGIGCHTMVALDSEERRGRHFGPPQMGGEGALWLGLAPFTSTPHFIQNMGDGTFHHSGSLAIRAAVAAGVNITFRLLYNDAVAMTGGQVPQGRLAVPDLVSLLAREGVARIVVTTPEPERYRGVVLDPIASVCHRDRYQQAQAELARVAGVTVLLHDDRCATEKRRLRKRGQLPQPDERIWINERVCEGCGDCGEVSSCLSVQPVQTQYGRKTQIHQSSCNHDRSCLKGDCPSFILVRPAATERPRPGPRSPERGPQEPSRLVGDEVMIRMPGVGGTGVVTAAAILRMAAHLEGRYTAGLDQTGLAQKGGPVVSDLRFSRSPIEGQIRAARASVDVLIGFDLLGCVDAATLATLDPGRTIAVLNGDLTPTAAAVLDVDSPLPAAARLIGRLRRATRAGQELTIPAARISERLFGDHMQANLVLVGAAYQHGCLPFGASAIERAIELGGVAVAANLAAFRWGRAVVADPGLLAGLELAGGAPATAAGLSLQALLERRCAELRAYQNAAYAQRYSRRVLAVAAAVAQRLGPGQDQIPRAYAEGLFKLMAYKDEYEVARLHLDAVERARLEAEFGRGAQLRVLLHPPLLRALGLRRKLALPASVATPLFEVLRSLRWLRGGVLDPFGQTAVRRLERALPDEYHALVERSLTELTPETAATMLAIARLPELVRGYEQIKLRGVERMRAHAAELVAELRAPPAAAPPRLEVVSSAR